MTRYFSPVSMEDSLADTFGPDGSLPQAQTVGGRIRNRRMQLGMTIQELADASKLTKSFVSQVERDRNSPSISSLRAIAAALRVPMIYFFQPEQSQKSVVRCAERRVVTFPQTGVKYEFLTPDSQGNVEMFKIRLETGQDTGERSLSHAGEECVLVIQGSVDVEINGVDNRLGTGDSVYIRALEAHRFCNLGPDVAVVVAAIAPPTF